MNNASWYPLRVVRSLLTDRSYLWILIPLIILGDALLTQLIIKFISYTEIDWETYMIHIELYSNGERNYTAITGPTGPLVYPAGHVYIHRILYSLTSSGLNIPLAQQIYGGLYLISLCLACMIYQKAGTVPNWFFVLLPLSKRLHSIFVLRLFNDCWATTAMLGSILSYCSGLDLLGTVLFNAALSVKMSILLYAPAILLILWKRQGMLRAAVYGLGSILVQIMLATPFLNEYPQQYFSQAFDLSRVFLYKWTVNWRFFSEEVFLDPKLARALLLGHLVTLFLFAVKWCRKDGGIYQAIGKGFRHPTRPVSNTPLHPSYVATMLMTANLIGITFARSLHYQFYSWYAFQVPYLASQTQLPVIAKLLILACIEYAWNVYPSTNISSSILLTSNLTLLSALYLNYKDIDSTDDKATKTQ